MNDSAQIAPATGPFRIRKYTPRASKRYQYDPTSHDAPPASHADFPGFAAEWGDGTYEVLDSKGRKATAIIVDGVGPGEHAGGQEDARAGAAAAAGIHPRARAKASAMLEEERVAMETARELNRQGRADLAARFLEGYWRTHGGQAGGDSALTITADGDAAREILAALRATRPESSRAPGPGEIVATGNPVIDRAQADVMRLGAYERLGEKLMDKARETIVDPLVGPGEDQLELGDVASGRETASQRKVGRVDVARGPQRGPPAAPPPDAERRRARDPTDIPSTR